MPRLVFRQLLENYPPTPDEAAFKEPMQQLLAEYDDCFENHLIPPGHFTTSAWLVGPDGTQALLTHHATLNRWLQLGGHADGDADVLQGALREAREESGLTRIIPLSNSIYDIDIHEIPYHATRNVPAHKHYDIRFLLYTDQTDYVRSAESHDLGWFDYAQLMDLPVDASTRRMARKWHDLQQNGQLQTLIAEGRKALENIN